tara:strand:- start:6387 stop:7085 length:699 start_codon:yes stop_codon:yes gene_type:complete
MANSKRLSEINQGRIKFTVEAEVLQEQVEVAVDAIREELPIIFPQIEFVYEREIYKNDIAKVVRGYNSSCGIRVANSDSSINPDGGFLFAKIDNEKKLILTVESKKQGTPASEFGTKGNAIERAFKNYNEVVVMQMYEDIFPYVLFISGSDFKEGSSICDRLTSMNLMRPVNKIDLKKVKLKGTETLFPCASMFVRPEPFEIKEIFDICLEVCKKSVRYYLNYGNKKRVRTA